MIIIHPMKITDAVYLLDTFSQQNISIKATIDGLETFVPLVEGNRHYDEIMRQVEAGTLTIADAETP